MATKFSMRTKAQVRMVEAQQSKIKLIETLLNLHDNDLNQVQACVEGVVDILGATYARMNADRNPFDDVEPREQRVVMGIIAAAKVLMDHPETVEGFNLTPNRLRQVMSEVGSNTESTKMMLQIAKAAPQVVSDIVRLFGTYGQAVQIGDEKVVADAKKQIQKLWMFWQARLPK